MTLIPSFSFDRTSQSVEVPPPSRFRPLDGRVSEARIMSSGATGSPKGMTPAQRAGLRFEARAQDALISLLGAGYLPAPRLRAILDNGTVRTLIPDGVYIRRGIATIFEIKSQHMPESWWQLRRLYEPAMIRVPTICHVNLVTVVKSYDPATTYPEPTQRLDTKTLRGFLFSKMTFVGVLVRP